MKKNKKVYYDIQTDLDKYPSCWCYVVWSKRGAGKTYSMLRRAKERGQTFLYVKRTNKDIDFLCSGEKIKKYTSKDPSPFAPLNRDFGWNIKPKKIMEGFAGFFECDDENEPIGDPIAFACSLNKLKDLKGYELSYAPYLVFDEFIPQAGEIVKKAEGEMLLDLYMTVSRDRQARGADPLKLILFANAEQIVTPVTTELEIVDNMALLDQTGERYEYIESRDILLHHITQEECPFIEEEKKGIYKGMEGTAWFDKAFGGSFSHVDFSNVRSNKRLTGYTCICALKHKRKWIYIYYGKNNSELYASSLSGNPKISYDLERENDQKRFYEEERPYLYDMCISERFKFEKYTYYDLIMNFKDHYKV